MRRGRSRWGLLWKLLGVAGLAGVAASGAVVARAERRRRAYTPDEVRARLQERAAAAREQAAGEQAAGEQGVEERAVQEPVAHHDG